MTIKGAIEELQNLMNQDDIPFYYKGSIKKVIETIQMDCRENITGEWLDEEYDIGECFATCSVCGEISQGTTEDNGWGYDYSFSKYCPNCGAKMQNSKE